MNRRSWFATIIAAIVGRKAAPAIVKPPSPMMDELNAYTMKHIIPPTLDVIYQESPLFWRFSGKDEPSFLIYSSDFREKTVWTDDRS